MNENLWVFLSSIYLIYLTFASVFFSVRVRTYIDIHVYIYTLVMSRDTGRAQVNLQINIRRDYRHNLVASNEQVFLPIFVSLLATPERNGRSFNSIYPTKRPSIKKVSSLLFCCLSNKELRKRK